ncbi:MAG: YciI family protein [Acidimicrobiales bacterium]
MCTILFVGSGTPVTQRSAATMTNFLISFPSSAMVFPDEDLQAVSDAAHAVLREAKDAGVWVFGGGIDESIPPVMVDGDGTVTETTYPQTKEIAGGYCILSLPSHDDAIAWAAKFAVACRCAQEVRAFQFDPES